MAINKPELKKEYDKQVKRIRSILSDIESVGLDVDFILPKTPDEPTDLEIQSLRRITPKELYTRTSFRQNGITIDVPETVARKAVKDFKLSGKKPSLNSIATSSTQPIPTPDGGTTIPTPEIDISPEERGEQVNPDNLDIVETILSLIDQLPDYASYHGNRTGATNAWITVDNTRRKEELRQLVIDKVEEYKAQGKLDQYLTHLKKNEYTIMYILSKLNTQPPSDEEEYEIAWAELAQNLKGEALTQDEAIAFTPQEGEGVYYHE